MSMKDDIDELNRRRLLALRMGGASGVERQHARGKLTIRERIDRLVDFDSLREFMVLAGTATYDGEALTEFVPKPTVCALARIEGRPVGIIGSDFTVSGGYGGAGGGLGQELGAAERSLEWRIPLVRLLDAAGGSVKTFEKLGRTYLPDGNVWLQTDVALLSTAPVVSAVLGSVAGLPAIQASMSHFSVMVKGIGQMFTGGPPVVQSALGYAISKEQLGGYDIHYRSGSIDNVVDNEDQAFEQIKRFLSYLPSSVHEMAPRGVQDDPADRIEEELVSLIPENRRKPLDAFRLLELLADRGSFFEIAPGYGRSRITGLARFGGWPVGITVNNPKFSGGASDVAAGNKFARLIQLCNTFHLPLIALADDPGFQVGRAAERQGIERAAAHLISHVCLSRMPWCTVVVGRLFGVGGQCHHRPSGMFRRYAWPSAQWGSMHILGGVDAAYRREIEGATDPAAKLEEIQRKFRAIASPFRTAEATGQDIIDPRETRRLLCEFVVDAQRVLATQIGPAGVPYVP